MKNIYKKFRIIALIAVIVFGVTACGSDSGGNNDPKITMTTTVSGNTCIWLLGTGKATIDWGDGNSEEVTLTDSNDLGDLWDDKFEHTYASDASKTITITGNVTGLATGYTEKASALNVSGMPGLKFLEACYEVLTELDPSKNTALEFLNCAVNQLEADALNAIFTALPPKDNFGDGYIRVTGNPGVNKGVYNKTIATAKNWDVKED